MYRVLIADDEPFVREGLKELINWEKFGFKLAGIYENGRDLLKALECDDIALVVLDIKMPVLSGLEVARTIHERYKKVSIIILSAYADFAYAKQAIEYQVKKYIVKSTLLEDLPKALEELKRELDTEKKDLESDENMSEEDYYEISEKVKKFIHENYDKELSLDVIAKSVYINRVYLSRLFKKKTGENLFDYINRYRIERAKEFIEQGNRKIYEIAYLCGFDDATYFARVFKKHTGISAREYEKSIHGK
jgi:hypothetical protein